MIKNERVLLTKKDLCEYLICIPIVVPLSKKMLD